jgi:signal transduction histidine kinase
MRSWLRGKRGGFVAFLLISALVTGGLGWVTSATLRLEREQLEAQMRAEQDVKLWLTMWKLEGRVARALAIEDNRPYNHYSPVYATSKAFVCSGDKWQPDTVLEPSPLLGSELPDWIALHFQTDPSGKWSSPEVLSRSLAQRIDRSRIDVSCDNVTPRREQLLNELKTHLLPNELLAQVRDRGEQLGRFDSTIELANFNANTYPNDNAINFAQQPAPQSMKDVQGTYQTRASQLSKVQNEGKLSPQKENRDLVGNNVRDPEAFFARGLPRPTPGDEVAVVRGPLVRLWLMTGDHQERLVAARLVQVGEREVCQGVVLDWERLQKVLGDEVTELLPDARLEPMRSLTPEHPERTMISLPIEVVPVTQPLALVDPGWTPLRVGLALAWVAALIALLAVGLGSWSLLDLSERRIRFVSAVTHELRTPLTTLRLYLDMLTGGLVRDETQKTEYLHTLHAEADRLHRLIANVLDFSRLEDQRPRLVTTTVKLGRLLEQVRATWQTRCHDAGKELIVENCAGDETTLETDAELTQQVLGNLIDNACKYSRDAEDRRIWLRANKPDATHLRIEVEDRGPGVAARERRAIFRPFRRGHGTDATGGVGLGLALAQRWTRLLGGQLSLRNCSSSPGACFQLELPVSSTST